MPEPTPPPARPRSRGRRRPWLAAGALLLTLAVLALATLTLPPVQRALVRRALVRAGATDIDLAGLRITPFGLAAQRIAFSRGGLRVAAAPVAVRLRPSRLIFRRTLDVTLLSVAKLEISSASEAAPVPAAPASPAAAPAAGFRGLLRGLHLPFFLAVEQVDLAGDFTLRRGAETAGRWSWTVRGGGLAPGRTGAWDWTGIADPAAPRPLAWSGAGRLRLTEAGEEKGLSRADLTGKVTPPPASAPALDFTVSLVAGPEGETYQVRATAGPGESLELNGGYAAATDLLSGRVTAAAGPELAQRLLGPGLPAATATLSADFSWHPRGQAIELALSLGADAAGLAAWRPNLAPLGTAHLQVDASLRRAHGAWTLDRGLADLTSGNPESLILEAETLHPVVISPLALSPEAIARVRIGRLPLAWANPWLASAGLTFGAGEISGSWNLLHPAAEGSQAPAFVLDPAEPLAAGPVEAKRAGAPALPALTLRASPRLEVSAGGTRLLLGDLHLASAGGDSLDLRTDSAWSAGSVRSQGSLDANLPTLLGGAGQPGPFLVTGRWALRHEGSLLRIEALQLATRPAPRAPASFTLALSQPVDLDLAHPGASLAAMPEDLAALQAQGLPLGWISRWLPGRELAGTWASGESRIRFVPGHGFTLETTEPWKLAGLRLGEGGRELFRGDLAVAPAAVFGPAERWLRLAGLDVRDRRGPWLRGQAGLSLRGKDDSAAGGIALQGEMPEPSRWHGTFGLLSFSLSASARLAPNGADLQRFNLTVTHAQGAPLLALTSAEPVHLERTPSAEWLASATSPLRLVTGQIPLAWLNPLLAPRKTTVAGVLPPTELQLRLSPRHFQLAAIAPLAASGFSLVRDGELLVDRGLVRFTPALAGDLTYSLLPVYRLRYDVVAGVTYGYVAAAGTRIALFDGEVQAGGDELRTSTGRASGNLWVDLGALGRLPLLANERLPAKGELRVSLTNDEARTQAVDFRLNVDRLVGRDDRPGAPLEMTGHAAMRPGERVGGFAVQALLRSAPRASDLRFNVRIDNQDLSVVGFSSKLEGGYVSLDAVRAFAAAFSPARAPVPVVAAAAALPAGAPAPAAPPRSGPPWGPWRGKFDLAIRQLASAPYEIDHLTGQLQVDGQSFVLHQLSGDLLGGRWSADFATFYQPGAAGGANALSAHFHLARFDAARVVRLTFPHEPPRLEGLLDLDVSLAGHADQLADLVPRATGTFSLSAQQGVLRLTLPNQDMISTSLILGGTLTFSPEMKALGRVVRQLQQTPFDRLAASGRLEADGNLRLEEFRLDSPQLRLAASGELANAKASELMKEALKLQATIAARSDLGTVLAGLKLLGPPGPDGYRSLTEPFEIGGTVGQPDFRPLYDRLARAASGSSGSWGLIMRKVEAEAAKHLASPAQVNR